AVREEVVALLALVVGEGAELGGGLGGGPGKRDRAPDAEMVAGGGGVGRAHPVELGEHPEQPGAAATRGAEDPGEAPRCRYGDIGCGSLWHIAPSSDGNRGIPASADPRRIAFLSDGSSH